MDALNSNIPQTAPAEPELDVILALLLLVEVFITESVFCGKYLLFSTLLLLHCRIVKLLCCNKNFLLRDNK